MDLNNLLLSKQDLEKYSTADIQTLAKYYGITTENRNDMYWLISLNVLKDTVRGTMNGSGKEEADLSTSELREYRVEKLNRELDANKLGASNDKDRLLNAIEEIFGKNVCRRTFKGRLWNESDPEMEDIYCGAGVLVQGLTDSDNELDIDVYPTTFEHDGVEILVYDYGQGEVLNLES